MKKIVYWFGKKFIIWGFRIISPKKEFNYSGNWDIAMINRVAMAVYHSSGRKVKVGIMGMLIQDGPGKSYVSCSYPKDKQLALNILNEMEKQITGRTLCARDNK